MEMVVCGSYRRGTAECGDIDILLTSKPGVGDLRGLTPRIVERLTHSGQMVVNLAVRPEGMVETDTGFVL